VNQSIGNFMLTKVSLSDLQQAKGKRKLTMLTAYDYPMAEAVDRAGLDIVLIGDSVANVVLGLDKTSDMTMDEMVYHAKAVRRAVRRAFLIGDMPFEGYQKDLDACVANARRFIDEAGCGAVKLEWFDQALDAARMIVEAGIPVMGHVGLTPQTTDKLGGFKVQGKDAGAARRIIDQAIKLEKQGCFSVLLECVPYKVAQVITAELKIPTIGIGAGPHCDGQVLVTHDMVGMFDRSSPKFVKKYLNVLGLMELAFKRFKSDVEEGRFPDKEHSYAMNPEESEKLDISPDLR
jgi:3-methyl-2-oxobutanoate hydroxymethyltransferase